MYLKKWWNETMTKDVCKDWAREQINFLITHQNNGFKIKALDSSSNEYLDNDFPPAL